MFKNLSKEKKRECLAFIMCVMVCFVFFMMPNVVYADNQGLNDIKAQMALFQELMAALVSSVGAVVLMWSIFKLGMAMQAGGNSGMEAQSFGAIGGGIFMVAAPQLVLIFTAQSTTPAS
ncbi:MAG: hypothetical protein ACI4TK_06125 [Agathobacter sp.]